MGQRVTSQHIYVYNGDKVVTVQRASIMADCTIRSLACDGISTVRRKQIRADSVAVDMHTNTQIRAIFAGNHRQRGR